MAANTQAIINEIQTLITGLSLYKTVEQGAIKDWTEAWPLAEIMLLEDNSEHYTHGGGIRDTQGFRVTSAVNFTQQTPPQALAQLISLRDTVIPLFQQRAMLTGITGVQDSRVKPGSPKVSFVLVNGDDYLVHEFIVEVHQTYYVPIGGANA